MNAWFLFLAFSINGDDWERLEGRFKSQQECAEYAQQFRGIARQAVCFQAPAKLFRRSG